MSRLFPLSRRTPSGETRPPSCRGRGRVLAFFAVLSACLTVFHAAVPNTVGRPGSLLETFLPWLGLTVPVLLGLALLRRSPLALIAPLLPAVAWISLFGGLLVPGEDREHDIVALQHNVSDENPDPTGTARALIKARPDLIALEELTPALLPSFATALAAEYPHHTTEGTVGLWSKYPLSEARPVDIKPTGVGQGWNRGLRATGTTPEGNVAVYVAHLPSLRLGLSTGFSSVRRDESAALLGAAIAAERTERVILLGDLNSTVDDRGLDPVRSQMNVPSSGFAFSWPASLPVARIDQIMARSATVTDVRSLPATGSDHLPIAAHIRF